MGGPIPMKKQNVDDKQTPRKSDPADRREVEERLRQSEERYNRIFENIQDIYYLLKKARGFVFWRNRYG